MSTPSPSLPRPKYVESSSIRLILSKFQLAALLQNTPPERREYPSLDMRLFDNDGGGLAARTEEEESQCYRGALSVGRLNTRDSTGKIVIEWLVRPTEEICSKILDGMHTGLAQAVTSLPPTDCRQYVFMPRISTTNETVTIRFTASALPTRGAPSFVALPGATVHGLYADSDHQTVLEFERISMATRDDLASNARKAAWTIIKQVSTASRSNVDFVEHRSRAGLEWEAGAARQDGGSTRDGIIWLNK